MSTGIEWTESTWNPTTGCDRVSPGCDGCYALTMAARLKGMGQAKYQRDGDPRTSGPGFGLTVHPDTLNLPLTWRKPRRVFVNSMSDLFHDDVPDEFIAQVFVTMARTPQHTYQILTKRHARMRSLVGDHVSGGHLLLEALTTEEDAQVLYDALWPLNNVWLGVSAENQKWADIRIPALLETSAAVRFLSAEPLLGPIDLTRLSAGSRQQPHMVYDALGKRYGVPGHWQAELAARLDWVIAGGESGPGARPMHPDWARTLRDHCTASGVPFFFKQFGAWIPESMLLHSDSAPAAFLHADGQFRPLQNGRPIAPPMARSEAITVRRVGKKAAGRELDGREWSEFPHHVGVGT